MINKEDFKKNAVFFVEATFTAANGQKPQDSVVDRVADRLVDAFAPIINQIERPSLEEQWAEAKCVLAGDLNPSQRTRWQRRLKGLEHEIASLQLKQELSTLHTEEADDA